MLVRSSPRRPARRGAPGLSEVADAMGAIDAPLPETAVIRLTDPPAQPLAQPSARRVRRPEPVPRVAVSEAAL